jgi:hypothetical protein
MSPGIVTYIVVLREEAVTFEIVPIDSRTSNDSLDIRALALTEDDDLEDGISMGD